MILTVPVDLDGERLDRVIARLAALSRAQAHSLVQDDGVQVDHVILRVPSGKVQAGSTLEFELPGPKPTLVAEPIEFEVVFEDEFVAVVDKPAGVVTHPGAGNARETSFREETNRRRDADRKSRTSSSCRNVAHRR